MTERSSFDHVPDDSIVWGFTVHHATCCFCGAATDLSTSKDQQWRYLGKRVIDGVECALLTPFWHTIKCQNCKGEINYFVYETTDHVLRCSAAQAFIEQLEGV